MTVSIMAIIGICGGLLCAVADCILDLKSADNKKLGKFGCIDSKWENMSHWRFAVSDIVAMLAVPMYTCGFLALMNCFIAACHAADEQRHEWVIAETTPERIIAMLCNRIPMCNVFICSQYVWIVSRLADNIYPISRKLITSEVPPNILPVYNCFIEAESGEFDSEIAELNRRYIQQESIGG